MLGKFYVVGVGPGDEELITIKGVKVMELCSVIMVPESKHNLTTALSIINKYIQGKEVVKLSIPMTKDEKKLQKAYETGIAKIQSYLKKGIHVAFANLGDPSIYGSGIYLHRGIKKMGYETEIIPGVPSFCAVAAALDEPLCEKDRPLHILPVNDKNIKDYLHLKGTLIFMKSGKNMLNAKKILQEKFIQVKAVEKASMKEEKVHKNWDSIDNEMSYFTVLMVKSKENNNSELN